MTTANKPAVRAFATAMAAAFIAHTASAATPVAVWDGAAAKYDFSTLTRTSGDNTYTLNLNPVDSGTANIVDSDNSYIVIGDKDAQPGITITADGTGIGSGNTLSIIMKCRNMPVSAGSNRAIISLMDGNLYKYGGTSSTDNGAVVGVYNNAGASGWIWKGSTASMTALTGDFRNTVSGAFSADEQIVALTYSGTGGTAYYVNGSLVQSHSGLRASELNPAKGIALGGVDVATGSQFYAMKNMQIEAIAIFDTTLAADEVAAYKFPSSAPMSGTVNVSDINELFGSATEIDVYLADGATITGDTTFNATKVNFHCEGSFSITPPADNEATFDFSDVSGRPVVVYSALPSVSGSKFTSNVVPSFVTDATQWTGVIYISSAAVANFTVNTFGNESSVVRLGNITGHLNDPGNQAFTNSVPVELVGTLYLNQGYSANTQNPNRCTVFKKLSGSGTIYADSNADKVVVVILDASEFTGGIGMDKGKIIVFGETMPPLASLTAGSIWVMEGASVTAQPASGNWWATGGIKVAGELRAANLGNFGGGTSITTFDTGVFTLTSTENGDEKETDTSYARITGTGSLKYEGTGWRALSTNNFPTGLTLVNEQAGDLLLSRALTYTVGSLSGTKNIQGNYGSGENSRSLRVLQSKDTEWSGTVKADSQNRFGGLTVAPGASTAGTLTLSGTQTQSAALTVESGAKVNLSGTWVGATTVAGTLGGTGAITGDLALSDGATLKVDDLSDPLAVSGDFSATAGTIAVELPAGTTAGAKFLQVEGEKTTGATFTVSIGGARSNLKVAKTSGGLKVIHSGLRVVLR